jgi:type IV secretion system protein TrbG
MKYLLAFLIFGLLTSCSSIPEQQFQPTTKVVEKTVTVPPPDLKIKYQLAYDNNPTLQKAYQQYLKTGKAPNIITNGFEQFAYGTDNQPVVAASVFELTVISLEEGENVTNVSSGDPTRWSYSIAYSGASKNRQAHIMVKPSQENISTDLVITTDRRLYTIKLVSATDGKYIRDVRFWYPQDMRNYWNDYNSKQEQKLAEEQRDGSSAYPNLNVNNLNFSYNLSHSGWHTPGWMPIQIFDDGTHTYIRFPPNISSRDMPALFIQNGKQQELVNYRSKPPYFVVDKIFEQAVLITGVGSDQVKVVITRT